jgi:hypothetical protein
MLEFEKKVKKILEFSFKYCLLRCNNEDLAEEISVSTTSLYCLKHNSINNYKTWMIGTIHNKLGDYFREENKKVEVENKIKQRNMMIYIYRDQSKKELDYFLDKISSFLTEEELKLMLDYYDKEIHVTVLSEQMNITINALRKRIQYLSQKVKALDKLERGYNFGKDLILPSINSKIISFLRALGDAATTCNLDKMKNYLADLPKDDFKFLRSIKEVIGIEFEKCDEQNFHLVLFFINKSGFPNGLELSFYFKGKSIRVKKVNDIFSEVVAVTNQEDVEDIADMLSERSRNEVGQYKIDKNKLNELTEKYSKNNTIIS